MDDEEITQYIGGYEVFDENHEVGPIYVWMQREDKTWYQSDVPLRFPSLLYENLKRPIIKRIPSGDYWICIDGAEGSGKTVLGTQICSVAAAIAGKKLRKRIKFDNDHVAYTSAECIHLNFNLPDWHPILLDEAMAAAHSKRSMSSSVVGFEQFMSQSRVLHKINVLILPRIFDLTGYLTKNRLKALIHFAYVFGKSDSWGHGKFVYYGERTVTWMGANADRLKKTMEYPKTRGYPMKSMRWPTIDPSVMDSMKKSQLERYREKAKPINPDEVIKEFITDRLIEIWDDDSLTRDAICKVFGVSPQTLYNYRNKRLEAD